MYKNMMFNSINKTLFLIAGCFCIFCYNCNTNKEHIIDGEYVIDIDKAEERGVFYLSDIVKKVRPIRLEETDYALIGEIEQVQAFDNNIFVLDAFIAKKLFVYDMNGKYVKQIGASGQGPDEYTGILRFCIDPDKKEIYLLDYWRYKLLKYRIEDGKLLDKIDLPRGISYWDMAYIEDNIYVCITHENFEDNDNLLLKIDLTTGEFQEYLSAGKIFKTNSNITGGQIIGNNPPLYGRLHANTVFSCKADSVYPYVVVQSSDWVHGEDIYDYDFDDLIENDRAYSIHRYFEDDTCIPFDYNKGKNTYHIAYNKQTNAAYHYRSIVNNIDYKGNEPNDYNMHYNMRSVNSKLGYDMMFSNVVLSFLKKGVFSPELAKQIELLNLDEEGYIILEYELK
jgi:hypothetical protein